MKLLTTIRQTISSLHLHDNTLQVIRPWVSPEKHFPLLKFKQKTQSISPFKSWFTSKPHQQILHLYLNFISRGQQRPQDIAYNLIEPTLRERVLKWLKDSNAKIEVNQCKVLQSRLLQRCEMSGIFIHRHYNLNQGSYTVQQRSKEKKAFIMKSTMRSQAYKLQDKLLQDYTTCEMKSIYHSDYFQFMKKHHITRQIYIMNAHLGITVTTPTLQQSYGFEGPTLHLVHLQSVRNPYSMVEECILCDVDFLLEGNPHLRKRL